MTRIIPKWIRIIASFIALLSLFVGVSLYASPDTFIPNIDFSESGVRFLTAMWAARQIAIGAIIIFALIRKSVPMLILALLGYLIMNVQDIIIGWVNNDTGLAFGASFFTILAGIMCFKLYKK